jgi:hypothetical protein
VTTISAPPYFTPLDRLLSVKHIELATQRVTIQAPKALCFEVIAAAGETVQKRSDTERVVDFDLEHKGQLIKTRELLNLRPPDAIDYRWLDGPLPFVEETISFEARGDRTTDMIYEGSFSLGSGWRNWLVGRFVVKRSFDRLALEHLEEGRTIAEKRAARSRLY